MKLTELKEGFFDRFKKQKDENEFITKDDRELIKKYFPHSDAFVMSPYNKEEYLLPENVKGTFGTYGITFYKRRGKLKASVSIYKERGDVTHPKVAPLTHVDFEVDTEEAMKTMKEKLE